MSTQFRFQTILLVDDDPADRIIASYAIEKYNSGAQIIEAIDGVRALALIEDANVPAPDLILLDINMPGMNGIEFLESYSASPSASRVVAMVSSSTATRDRDRCAQFDCVIEYFEKPLEASDLAELDAALS